MKRPLIGINGGLHKEVYYRLDARYAKAVIDAGGIPVLMPFFEDSKQAREFLGNLDGVLFTGGADINPSRWDEKPHKKSELLPKRKEASDFFAIEQALKADQPVLGICYGFQLLNVFQGGSLHQHLPDLDGGVEHRDGEKHKVLIDRSTRLGDILGTKAVSVTSYHHQGVNAVGRRLTISSTAPDGIVEGLESDDHRFVVAVQWHPERIQNQPEQRALMKAFVNAAR